MATNSKRVSALIASENRYAHSAYKKMLSHDKNNQIPIKNKQNSQNKQMLNESQSTSVSNSPINYDDQTINPSNSNSLYHKKTIKKQCSKIHDHNNNPYIYNKVNLSLSKQAYQNDNSNRMLSQSPEKYNNMPFNLKEKRFLWQTDVCAREIIGYSQNKIGIRISPDHYKITKTILPQKQEKISQITHIKCNYPHQRTSSLIDLTERKHLDESYNKKNLINQSHKRIIKNDIMKNAMRSASIASLLKKTPDSFPIKGKKRIEFNKIEPEFKPTLKQNPNYNCFTSNLSGGAVFPSKTNEINNGFSKFHNKKNQVSNNIFESKGKKMINTNSMKDLTSIYNNRNDMSNGMNNKNYREEFDIFSKKKNNNSNNNDADDNQRGRKSMKRRLSTSVIDYRFKSTLKLC